MSATARSTVSARASVSRSSSSAGPSGWAGVQVFAQSGGPGHGEDGGRVSVGGQFGCAWFGSVLGQEPEVALGGGSSGRVGVGGDDRVKVLKVERACRAWVVGESSAQRRDARRTGRSPARVTAKASRGPSTSTGVAPRWRRSGTDAVELAPLWNRTVSAVLRYFGPACSSWSVRSGWRRPTKPRIWSLVGDRQDDPVTEPVDQGPGAGPGGQPGFEELVVGDAAAAEVVNQAGPPAGCVAGGDVRVGAPAGSRGPGRARPKRCRPGCRRACHCHGVDRGQTLRSGDGVVPGGGALDHAFDLGVGGFEDPHGLPVQSGGGELGGDVTGAASIDGLEGRGRRRLADCAEGASRSAPSKGRAHVLSSSSVSGVGRSNRAVSVSGWGPVSTDRRHTSA